MRSRLPWLIWTVTLVGLVTAQIVSNSGTPSSDEGSPDAPILIAFFVFVLGFATAGALISSRHPKNPVGWLLSTAAFVYICAGLADSFVTSFPRAVAEAGAGVRLLVAIGESLWAVGLGIGASLVLLLFPDGRLPGPRWRPVGWTASIALIVIAVGQILKPGGIQDYPVENPIGIPGAGSALEGIVGIAYLSLAVIVPLSMASLFFRYRKVSAIQRQQLKLLLSAAGMVAFCFLISLVLEALWQQSDAAGEVANFLTTASLALIPLAIGTAILKHRLYDIDVIINRALVYTGLTAVLALVYIGVVFGLQQVLSPITQESDLAIAASTLAVAALFRPARTRVQRFIDHRFYRRKFDAQRTLDGFSTTLRDEVDLTALSARLTGIVSETMQPAHVSLWLRAGTAGEPK